MDTSTKSNIKAATQTNSGTPIADKVTDTLHQSVDTLAGHAATAEKNLRNTASSSAETIGAKSQQAKQYWDQSAVGQFTKENPIATAGIAFAAGMLLTTVLRRK